MRERGGETDRQTDRQTDRDRERELYVCSFNMSLILTVVSELVVVL